MRRFCVVLMVLVTCAWALAPALAAEGSPGWPLDGPSAVLLGFGVAYTDESGRAVTHRGIDLAAPAGSYVRAAGAGTVTFAGRVPADDGATRLAVTVDSGGYRLTYLPLAELSVRAGDRVGVGAPLGTLAATGDRSSPVPHLHVGARIGDLYVDPMGYLAPPVAAAPDREPAGAPEAETAPAPASVVAPVSVAEPGSATVPLASSRATASESVPSQAGAGAGAAAAITAAVSHAPDGGGAAREAARAPLAPSVDPIAQVTGAGVGTPSEARTYPSPAAGYPLSPQTEVGAGREAGGVDSMHRFSPAEGVRSTIPHVIGSRVRRGLLAALGLALGAGLLWPIWRVGSAKRGSNALSSTLDSEDVAAVSIR